MDVWLSGWERGTRGGILGTAEKRSASILGMRACNSLGENNDGVGRELPVNLSVGFGK